MSNSAIVNFSRKRQRSLNKAIKASIEVVVDFLVKNNDEQITIFFLYLMMKENVLVNLTVNDISSMISIYEHVFLGYPKIAVFYKLCFF